MKQQKRTVAAVCVCALAFSLAACAQGAEPAASASATSQSTSGTGYSHWRGGRDIKKYTQADYDLALSFRTEGYQDLSVEAFNKSVLDWTQEAAYHKTEEVLQRLFARLPDDDANADFIFRTLGTTWDECEKKHYNACPQNAAPRHSGWAKAESYGDVYGDPLLLTGAYVDFDFDYTIPDPAKLTVGQRDALLQGVEKDLQAFLEKQDLAHLRQEDTMEKTLTTELKRLLKALNGELVWNGNIDLGYYFEEPWHYEQSLSNGAVTESGTAQSEDGYATDRYTQKQYDQALAALKFDGYEKMSIAEFDRKVIAAFNDDREGNGKESLDLAYEMLREFLPEKDPHAFFFSTTVPAAMNEYEARVEEVYSGRQKDPEWTFQTSSELTDDVYGDSVVTGEADAYGTFTYQIVDADALTVAERDAFLKAMQEAAQQALETALQNGEADEAAFQKALEDAGRAAQTANIRFTGCNVEYVYAYR